MSVKCAMIMGASAVVKYRQYAFQPRGSNVQSVGGRPRQARLKTMA